MQKVGMYFSVVYIVMVCSMYVWIRLRNFFSCCTRDRGAWEEEKENVCRPKSRLENLNCWKLHTNTLTPTKHILSLNQNENKKHFFNYFNAAFSVRVYIIILAPFMFFVPMSLQMLSCHCCNISIISKQSLQGMQPIFDSETQSLLVCRVLHSLWVACRFSWNLLELKSNEIELESNRMNQFSVSYVQHQICVAANPAMDIKMLFYRMCSAFHSRSSHSLYVRWYVATSIDKQINI